MRRAAITLAGLLFGASCHRDRDTPGCAHADDCGSASASATSVTGGATEPIDSTTAAATTGAGGTGGDASAMTTLSDTTTTGPDTTTGGPVCGDGVVEGDEECDGGDLCHLCVRDRVVFVSSEVYQGDDIGGLAGADALCRGLAVKAGLANGPSFMAWLSSTTEDPAARMFHSPGRYILVNGLVVADDWAQLTSGALQRPIDTTELGVLDVVFVWTGTLPDGTRRMDSEQCDDWTSLVNVDDGWFGISMFADQNWTMASADFVNPSDCNDMLALYCVEQE